MKIKPVLTEKSLAQAKKGWYTFRVLPTLTKPQIRIMLERVFGVHIVEIKTQIYKEILKKDFRGRMKKISGFKKALIKLMPKEKIDLFEAGEKKK